MHIKWMLAACNASMTRQRVCFALLVIQSEARAFTAAAKSMSLNWLADAEMENVILLDLTTR
jgi:hypothetical protein